MCRPCSFAIPCSHNRPTRSGSPAFTACVQSAHPIEFLQARGGKLQEPSRAHRKRSFTGVVKGLDEIGTFGNAL